MNAPRAPLFVAQIELDQPLADIACGLDPGHSYRYAWILARRHGRPVCHLTVEIRDGIVSADRISEELAASHQIDWPESAPVDEASLPHVTVVVPTTMTRVDQIKASIAKLLLLDYPKFDVVVVDNRDSETEAVLLEGVTVVREPRPGISAARNAGLRVARGEIVACTDDDVEVDGGWLHAIAERFVRDPDLVALAGLVVPHELETDAQVHFERYQHSGGAADGRYSPLRFTRSGLMGVRTTDLVAGTQTVAPFFATAGTGIGANMAFRREHLLRGGGFDVALGAGTIAGSGEDTAALVDVVLRGQVLGYEPSAIVWHKHRSTMEALESQIYGYGVGITAWLTATALRRPVYSVALLRLVPAWAASKVHRAPPQASGGEDDYNAHLLSIERSGMVVGPLRYLQGRAAQWRWDRRRHA
jgi:GT2 family glycosyltransferase